MGGLAAVAVLVAGCSGSDDGAAPTTTRAGASTTLATIVAVTSTTTVPGERVSSDEAYAAAGLTAAQARCITDAGVDGDFEIAPGRTAADATVLTAADGTMVAVDPSIRTGAELERLLLTTLAADCAPADRLDALAASEGAATDAAALDDDLPAYLTARRADGATAREQTCLEAGFRAAPVLLSSLAARPAVVEAGCASAERRAAWRRAALERGLEASGASSSERRCIAGDTTAQLMLASAVEALGSGDPGADPLRGQTSPCFSGDRLRQLALTLVAEPPDLGAEELAPSATTG